MGTPHKMCKNMIGFPHKKCVYLQRYSLIKCGIIDDYSLIKCDFKIRIMERLAINELLKWKNKLGYKRTALCGKWSRILFDTK